MPEVELYNTIEKEIGKHCISLFADYHNRVVEDNVDTERYTQLLLRYLYTREKNETAPRPEGFFQKLSK